MSPTVPDWMLMNDKGPCLNPSAKFYGSFRIAQGNEIEG